MWLLDGGRQVAGTLVVDGSVAGQAITVGLVFSEGELGLVERIAGGRGVVPGTLRIVGGDGPVRIRLLIGNSSATSGSQWPMLRDIGSDEWDEWSERLRVGVEFGRGNSGASLEMARMADRDLESVRRFLDAGSDNGDPNRLLGDRPTCEGCDAWIVDVANGQRVWRIELASPVAWGAWTGLGHCDSGSYIDGLQQRINSMEGPDRDDAGMVAIRFRCGRGGNDNEGWWVELGGPGDVTQWETGRVRRTVRLVLMLWVWSNVASLGWEIGPILAGLTTWRPRE